MKRDLIKYKLIKENEDKYEVIVIQGCDNEPE